MKYPAYGKELLQMIEEDQNEIRNAERVRNSLSTEIEREKYNQKIVEHCHKRAEKMLEILDAIGAPTIENIGPKAAEIFAVFALHSHIDDMKKVLAVYERQFELDPDSIYKGSIPPLTDRIMIAEQRRQIFGTNWCAAKDGTWSLIPVHDFAHVNERRKRYGLSPISKPRNLSVGAEEYPLGKGFANEGDQKELTDEEHARYTENLYRK